MGTRCLQRRNDDVDSDADLVPVRKMISMIKQIEATPISDEKIMRSAAFRHGVADYRNGRAPRSDYEETDDRLLYEYGRQFAAIAPRTLQIVLPETRQLNPEAVEFFKRHEGDIC
jgi:hypothetical protein